MKRHPMCEFCSGCEEHRECKVRKTGGCTCVVRTFLSWDASDDQTIHVPVSEAPSDGHGAHEFVVMNAITRCRVVIDFVDTHSVDDYRTILDGIGEIEKCYKITVVKEFPRIRRRKQ